MWEQLCPILQLFELGAALYPAKAVLHALPRAVIWGPRDLENGNQLSPFCIPLEQHGAGQHLIKDAPHRPHVHRGAIRPSA